MVSFTKYVAKYRYYEPTTTLVKIRGGNLEAHAGLGMGAIMGGQT